LYPRPLEVRLSVVDVWDLHRDANPNTDVKCAVILRVENLGSSELIFADDLTAQVRVGNHWLEPNELLWQVRTLGFRLLPGAKDKLAVAAPPGTETVRLFLKARPPALIERLRWFLIDKSSSLEPKVNWRWMHLHLPLVPGWRRGEYEISLPQSLRPASETHTPAASSNATLTSMLRRHCARRT
jgi:hypothetical protein